MQGLKLWQAKLSTEKYLDEANERIKALEEEIATLREEREKRKIEEKNAIIPGPRVIDKKTSSSRWWFTSA